MPRLRCCATKYAPDLLVRFLVVNSIRPVSYTHLDVYKRQAWYCLLIEDARPKDLVGIYTWVNICGLVAIFFAPLSGLFVLSLRHI